MNNLTQLIEGCQKGDRNAQMQLYDQFASTLYVIALRYCSSREDAEDVLQESFIKVFKSIGQFQHKGSFEGWIKRVCVNVALGHLRKQQLMFAEYTDESIGRLEAAPMYSDNLELNDLLGMINQLPVQKRTIFNLYEIEGFSHKEIAVLLDITEASSRSQLAKAKTALKVLHTQANRYYEKVS